MFRSRSVTAAPAISFGCWIGRCASSASPPSLPGGAGNRADYLAAPAIHAATTYVTCRSRLPQARSYRIVVLGSACEAASCTSRKGTPASRAAVMNAWRSVCGPTGLVIPARAAAGGRSGRRYRRRAEPVLQLRHHRGHRQPAESDQTTDVRPRQPDLPQTRHPSPRRDSATEITSESMLVAENTSEWSHVPGRRQIDRLLIM